MGMGLCKAKVLNTVGTALESTTFTKLDFGVPNKLGAPQLDRSSPLVPRARRDMVWGLEQRHCEYHAAIKEQQKTQRPGWSVANEAGGAPQMSCLRVTLR